MRKRNKERKVFIVTDIDRDPDLIDQFIGNVTTAYKCLERAVKPFREKIDIKIGPLTGFWPMWKKAFHQWPEEEKGPFIADQQGQRILKTLFIDYDAVFCFKKPTKEFFEMMGFSNFGKLTNQDDPRRRWPDLEIEVFHQMNSVLTDGQPIRQFCYDPVTAMEFRIANPAHESMYELQKRIHELKEELKEEYPSREAHAAKEVDEYLESLFK